VFSSKHYFSVPGGLLYRPTLGFMEAFFLGFTSFYYSQGAGVVVVVVLVVVVVVLVVVDVVVVLLVVVVVVTLAAVIIAFAMALTVLLAGYSISCCVNLLLNFEHFLIVENRHFSFTFRFSFVSC
jgi:hypothetical protein